MATKKTLPENYGIEGSKLMLLFEESLKDIYWAEKALVKALNKMAKRATSEELADAIEAHLTETEEQVEKIEKVFTLIGKKARAKKCEAMAGLIEEAEAIMAESEEGAMRDAGIIAAAQKAEHYEIATYGTLSTYAKTLALDEASIILDSILNEEKNADKMLTDIALSTINIRAAQQRA
jgi:ferritin-like metal-binding protein YciE